jgi:hypothetical protein
MSAVLGGVLGLNVIPRAYILAHSDSKSPKQEFWYGYYRGWPLQYQLVSDHHTYPLQEPHDDEAPLDFFGRELLWNELDQPIYNWGRSYDESLSWTVLAILGNLLIAVVISIVAALVFEHFAIRTGKSRQ